MRSRECALAALLAVAVCWTLSAAMHLCQPPAALSRCKKRKCPAVTQRLCAKMKAEFRPKGGLCGRCPVCVTVVGEGHSCNVTQGFLEAKREREQTMANRTAPRKKPFRPRLPVIYVCRAPLVCSRRQKGICRSDCYYETAAPPPPPSPPPDTDDATSTTPVPAATAEEEEDDEKKGGEEEETKGGEGEDKGGGAEESA